MEDRAVVKEKKSLLFIVNIILTIKTGLTLLMTLLLVIFGFVFDGANVWDGILMGFNGIYILVAEIFLCLALWGYYLKKNHTIKEKVKKVNKKKNPEAVDEVIPEQVIPYNVQAYRNMKIASIVSIIGFNVVIVLVALFTILYLVRLVFTISGANALQFFVSLGYLILVLIPVLIFVLSIYSFYGALHRYSQHKIKVIQENAEENKSYFKVIPILLYVVSGVVVVFSLLVWLLSLLNVEFFTTYVGIFFNNALNVSTYGGVVGILLLVSSLLTAGIYVAVGILLSKIEKNNEL